MRNLEPTVLIINTWSTEALADTFGKKEIAH